mgnify:CR=1 FL=1
MRIIAPLFRLRAINLASQENFFARGKHSVEKPLTIGYSHAFQCPTANKECPAEEVKDPLHRLDTT